MEGKSYFQPSSSFLFVGSYPEQCLQFCRRWEGGEPGQGKEAEQPSVRAQHGPEKLGRGLPKIPIGSSSISLGFGSEANEEGGTCFQVVKLGPSVGR